VPASAASWLSRHLTRLGAAVLALVVAGVVVTIWTMREDTLADAQRGVTAQGTAVAEQAERAVQAVDLVLQDIQADFMPLVTNSPLGDNPYFTSLLFHRMLQDGLRNLPQLSGVNLIDPQGRFLATSREWPAPALSQANQPFFVDVLQRTGWATLISQPFRSRADGSWIFYLARRIETPDHRLAGVLEASLPSAYFETLFRAVAGGGATVVTLIRRDGILLNSFPHLEDHIGQPFPPYPGWAERVAAGGGHYISPGLPGMPPHLISVHPLPLHPLVVDVGLDRAAALSSWRHMAALVSGETLLGVVSVMLLLHMLAVRLRALDHERRELAATARALAASEAGYRETAFRLETTLSAMDEGLMMVDAQGIVAVCNARARELLELPEELLRGQPAFTDVLRHQFRTDEFECSEEWLQQRLRFGDIIGPDRVYERRRPNGTVLEVRSTPLPGGGMVRTFTDITARRAAEDQLRFHADHDELTGLANRQSFRRRLDQAIGRARADGEGFALLYLDLDRFKQVNDTRGHPVGDRLLCCVAARIREEVRTADLVARIGGDEFIILLTRSAPAEALAARLLASLPRPYEIEGQAIEIGVSIGIACCPRDADTTELLLQRADAALYAAKGAGRGTVRRALDATLAAVTSGTKD
jgi:diguanylate cyclase (GGDEF)-like protein